MKIIALSGVYDSGKTTVLLELLRQLKQMNSVTTLNNQSAISSSYGRDRRELVQIINGSNTLRVGVCTGGDTRSIVQQNFAFFNANNCDVCITACRSVASTETVNEVLSSARKVNVYPYFVAKMRTSSVWQQRADTQAVAQLYSMIY